MGMKESDKNEALAKVLKSDDPVALGLVVVADALYENVRVMKNISNDLNVLTEAVSRAADDERG